MIVLVLGVILAGVALPGAVTFDDQRLAATMRVLAADIEFVQARAIATGQSHRILFLLQQQSYQVESPPGVLLLEPLKKTPWLRELEGEQGTELLTADFGGSTALVFDPSGIPTAGGAVTFARGNFAGEVAVAAVVGVVTLTLP